MIRQLVKIAPQDSRTEVVNEVCGDNPTMIRDPWRSAVLDPAGDG